MGLALLAPGSRTSSTNEVAPLLDRNRRRGTRISAQPGRSTDFVGARRRQSARYSQDSIAEFQFVSNRFDATQGRLSGVQVNAITRSGSNRFSGLFRSNFRDSSFNAQDPVLGRVVPIKNQQYSTTLGGPIITRQAALLRELRIRAGAADEHLEHALPRLQHRVDRHESRESSVAFVSTISCRPDARDGKDVQTQELASPSAPGRPTATRRRRARTTNATRSTSGTSRRC